MEITRLSALSDNYIFLLSEKEQKIAAVVDPTLAQPVLEVLHKQGLQLVAILNTHHHRDHVGGNQALIEHFPKVCVYAGAEDRGRILGQQVFLKEGDRITFADRVLEVFFVPGHTRAHIAYYFPPQGDVTFGELFCGDTLFSGGCGRLFEGTPAQMVKSLTKLRSLPDSTRVWCAHEYTLKNLEFALVVDPDNTDLQNRFRFVQTARLKNEATIPTWLGVEKLTNPFLRWDNISLQKAMRTTDPVQTFARLRGQKEQF
ncbi:hydroxyacylglutathione hydrolase [Aphanothece hegewaldii CCALA 016]|uniref:Hydroxyacylglutathione hydrolase n=1 Tax=Aphanothece hegewaldii CCALA 016 TaxID=2107694 RepID=A0A2T1LY53_9CHRO|nr:hydroxyacylglutathione hydrolase [Aphanothece hegewaldii]PSF37317.1 hydroxyacylglutathione hydrolase [Aphanothece hegewaldii CCALA 016]